ncbi:Nif3-like dinuclear metal center hexameric protein [Desulfovibrionales bacterium]
MQPQTLIRILERTAPLHLAASWDKSGVQIASRRAEVRTLCVALDPTEETVRRAVDAGADFLLCHHPLTLQPDLPRRVDAYYRVLRLCLSQDLWLYSAHTSLDANPHGPVNWLADLLGLVNRQVLAVTHRETATLLRVYDALPWMQDKLAECVESNQMRSRGETCEMVLWPEELRRVRSLLSDAGAKFPYQEIALAAPARDFGFGCIGDLPVALSFNEILTMLQPICSALPRLIGATPSVVRKVGYCPGSGADLAARAFALGADIFLTGDVKFHQAQDMMSSGLTMDVGHFCLEEEMMRVWSTSLTRDLSPDRVQVLFLDGRDPFVRM